MKKATVTFEITENTTTVISTGTKGNVERFDITGTDSEKRFIALLKKLQEHQLSNKILEAIDINNWEIIGNEEKRK